MANLFLYTGNVMPDIKKTLSESVTKLLDTRQDMSRLNLSKQMRVADGTLGRIKYGNGNPNVETLDAIARFFKFEAWQLLISGFDPKHPPRLWDPNGVEESKILSDAEKQLLDDFRALTEPERTYLVNQAQAYRQAVEDSSKKPTDLPTEGAA